MHDCMQKFQKLLVFDIFRKFTKVGTGIKIPKAYCTSTDYMQQFYNKIKTL